MGVFMVFVVGVVIDVVIGVEGSVRLGRELVMGVFIGLFSGVIS